MHYCVKFRAMSGLFSAWNSLLILWLVYIWTYRVKHGELSSNMANATNLDKGVMERLKLRIPELIIVETEEIVHDDVARQGGKGIGEIEGLCIGLKLLHARVEGVDVAVDDMDKIKNGAA